LKRIPTQHSSLIRHSIQVKRNSLEWIQIYTFIEEGNFTEEYESYANDLVDVKKYELHKIGAIPTIFPYYDMVRWIISYTNISTHNC
jgi:hypothetical protein